MTATIHPLPLMRRTLPAGAAPLRTYDLAAMARLMGWQFESQATVISRLRTLARAEGLPLPCSRRIRTGRLCHGPSAICARSLWDAQQVDAWQHRPGPAAPPAALPPVPPATRAAMAQRAAQLVAGGRS